MDPMATLEEEHISKVAFGKIMGFWGRSCWYLDQIGVFTTNIG
jgi:hypothetical protein